MNTFKRYELKYMLNKSQYEGLLKTLKEHMVEDNYGLCEIANLYYDTNNYQLIRTSIEKPTYKEKLRIRTYGKVDENTKYFVELKKKYDGIVYKRRLALDSVSADKYINKNQGIEVDNHIAKEIEYFKDFYPTIAPKMYISYKRVAFYGMDDPDFRMTIDQDITYRDYDLDLSKGSYGEKLLDQDTYLLEIKTAFAMPLWLVRTLSEYCIYKTSFSKYGTAYKNILTGGRIYA